ncbi:MAG: helix-turn-helix domain-containing protein [Chloroflexi bacterium]|nr:helix-turn-helix domain-containing protein [Chloroflexota bacterium]
MQKSNQTSDRPLVYSVDEVARKLQISRNLAFKLAREKRLPGVIHLGNRRMCVSAAVIDRLLAGDNHQAEQ